MKKSKIADMSSVDLVKISGSTTKLQAQEAQAELLRRNTDALKSSSEFTKKHSDIMFGLTLVLFFVALMQLLFTVLFSSYSNLEKGFIVILVGGIVYFGMKDVSQNLEEKKKIEKKK